MDKVDNIINNYNHGITLVERKTLNISGVKKIENIDNEEFLMETTMGYLLIKGEDLELIKLDTMQGNVSIKGMINALDYVEETKTKENTGIFSKIFK